MSFFTDDQNIGGQLKVGIGIVPAIGEGPTKVNGSAYIEGPIVMGSATAFPCRINVGCLNVGPLVNEDTISIWCHQLFLVCCAMELIIHIHSLCLDHLL